MSELFSVGHSTMTPEAFVELLSAHAIDAVVDVRSIPRSRWVPHFNRGPAGELLAGAGISYVWEGARLGGRPHNTRFYDRDGHVQYRLLAEEASFQSGIEDLVEMGGRVAVMCTEKDWAACHRHLLIGRVLYPGVVMAHIEDAGTTVPYAPPIQRSLFGEDDAWTSVHPSPGAGKLR